MLPGMPRGVVLDVDTGVDDACALLLAALHPGLDLRAVSCVGGNAPLDLVVRQHPHGARRRRPPGRPGRRGQRPPAARGRPVDARHVHGEDGLGDLGLAEVDPRPDPRHAVELLRDVLRESARRPVTLVTLAPLTNVALLLRTYPDVARNLRDIVVMGGAANVGNATASAEFNVFHDPEAAAITLDAAADLGVAVTLYGLDVFYEPRVTAAQARDLAGREHPGAPGWPGCSSGSSASGSATRPRSATPGRCARSSNPARCGPNGCPSASSSADRGRAGAPSSTAAAGRST